MPRDIHILTEAQLRQFVSVDETAIDIVAKAFATLAGGAVIMPPIMSMDIPSEHGEVDVKTAYIPGFDGFAVKISPGFFNNPSIGLPSTNGLMVLFSAKTGVVEAVLLDNGYLTDVRTAAAGGLAAKLMAPKTVETAGVMGTGAQARLQIQAAHLVRPFKKVLVWGRDTAKAAACAADIAASIGVDAIAEADPARLVAESQLVVTTTPSAEAVLKADWLHPGLHITAMGSDQTGKNEIDPAAFTKLDIYVADRISQCEALGELRSALQVGTVTSTDGINELGQVVLDPSLGRKSDREITLCDLTGTGAQDTAIATFAFAAAKAADAGTIVEA
jgi:ectoine utilization protein EutC